jgi:hypothetical protein
LPVTYPASGSGSFAITNSIDDQLKAPYTMNVDFSIGRDFGHGWFVQGSYVGRFSRHSLIQRDLAMPTDLVDPKSGQDYFSAMNQLATQVDFQHVAVANLAPIPFFQNMWAGAGVGGLSPTQVWGLDYTTNSAQGDFTNTLNNADNAANCGKTSVLSSKGGLSQMACGIYGPWMIFNSQFSALSANSSIGIGDYHAMQWTIRKSMRNLVLDVNYTWSKSIDDASTTEAGTFTGFVINTWNPSQMKGVSSYDTTQQINASVIYQLPFGRSQKFLGSANKIVDAFIGGWQVSVLYRQTSGLPFTVINGQRWPTNWEVDANATLTGTLPSIVSTGNSNLAGGGPNLWANPSQAFAAFSETMAGQSGQRNMLRGNGLFNIDTGVSKSFQMPWSEKQGLQFRWETFNLTNTVRFDPASASLSTISSSNFGALSSTLGTPRVMQFALRYKF